MSIKNEKRIDVIKLAFATIREKKLEKKRKQKINQKTALIRLMSNCVWVDTYATYPSR
jgi:hypothetical protein